jgi:hypothetical protein
LDGTYQWTFDSNGTLTLPGATAGETIATQSGYITVGNLLIGQGGALFNSNNDSWALYGNLSDPGATIFIPSNADAGNGTPLYIESQQSNVEIRSGGGTWNFGNTGVLTLPNADATGFGNIYFEENSSTITFGLDDNATPYLYSFSTSGITLPKGGVVSEGVAPTGIGNTIAITPSGGSDANQQLLVYPTGNIVEGNHLHLTTGDLYNTELFLGNDNLYVKLANTGNVVINSYDGVGNAGQWTFGTDGNLTLPGNIIAINYADGNRVTGGITFNGEAVIGTGTSNTQSGLYLAPDPVSLTNDLYLRVRGNVINEPTHIHFDTGNNQYYNQYIGDDNKYILLANTGNVVVNTNDNAGNSAQWIFNNFGTLSLPGGSQIRPLGANLDISSNGGYVNLITADESSYMGVSGNGGFITSPGGTWQFDATGNLTAPGNISAVGNVTAANFFGNGNTLSNVSTQVTSSWTLAAGTNTVSFTVPLNGTYSMWVRGNIPNGIVVWNATATVTNNNVPAIGQQFSWYYPAPGNALELTSIPAQIIGIANTISNATPAVGTTTNVFEFTIINNSGNAAAVNYGYTKIG